MEEQKTSTRGGTRQRTPAGAGAQRTADTPEQAIGANTAPGTSGAARHGGIVDKVKEGASARLSSQKGRATDGLETIAQAVRQTTEQLRARDEGAVAEYMDKAAGQLERLSHRLRDKDVNELLQDARRLAERQPAMFIGGSFALGLVAARFIRSSQQDGRHSANRREGEADLDQYSAGGY